MIRKAWAKDAKALKYLYEEVLHPSHSEQEWDQGSWEKRLDRFYQDPQYHILVAEEAGCVVATVTFVIVENLTYQLRPYGIIENVVTHPDYQKQGYASALIQRALEIAKAAHCYKVTVATGSKKKSTLDFYRKNGFRLDEKTAGVYRFE